MKRKRTLSMRWWLALSVLLAGLFTLLFTMAYQVVMARPGSGPADPVMVLRSRIAREHSSWRDPAWQAQLSHELNTLGLDVLLAGPRGEVLYQSRPKPLAALPASAWRAMQDGLTVTSSFRSVDVYTIHDGDALIGSVQLYRPWPAATPVHGDFRPLGLALLAVGLGILLAVAVMLRLFLPPLRALAAAAEQVRRGDLDFTLRPSPVREVDAVLGAFTQMAQGLRQLTYRQAAMDEERRLFLAAISHDLRTPLFSVRGRLEGIRDGIAATPEQARQYAALALKTLSALERLVADLFTYTRLNLLAQDPRRDPIDWWDLLRQSAQSMQPLADAKGIRLTLPAKVACQGTGDEHLLGRAIANLLDNAIRHTPPGGDVCLGLDVTGHGTRVSVADSGPGIDPQAFPRLFTPGASPSGGTGLGLVIARAAVEAHGGTIAAANVPGGGARFTITLPGPGAGPAPR